MIDKIIDRTESISLVGLGYVGMPIAVAFAKKANVIHPDGDSLFDGGLHRPIYLPPEIYDVGIG